MTGDKESVQMMFDEIAERTGMPRVDLSQDDSAVLPFGDEMLLHVQYRKEIPEVVFTVPLGRVPQSKKAEVYERLLAANFYWIQTQGATLGYQGELGAVVLQYQEGTDALTSERLQSVLEGFLSVAIKWKGLLAEFVDEAEGGDDETALSKKEIADAPFMFEV